MRWRTHTLTAVCAFWLIQGQASGWNFGFTAYNDTVSGAGTHANTTTYSGRAGNDTYTYEFAGLDPGYTYDFAGTAIRGNNTYNNRWTLVSIIGADLATPAHSTGIGVVVQGLQQNEVALWTGANHNADQGFVVRWTDIDPGQDGIFEIVSTQYTGPSPGVGSGTADGTKGYAISDIRLIETVPEPATIALLALGVALIRRTRRGETR